MDSGPGPGPGRGREEDRGIAGCRRSRPCSCPPARSAGSGRTRPGGTARPGTSLSSPRAAGPVMLFGHDWSFVEVARLLRCGAGRRAAGRAAGSAMLPSSRKRTSAGSGYSSRSSSRMSRSARPAGPTSAGSSWSGDLVDLLALAQRQRSGGSWTRCPCCPRPAASRCGVWCPRWRWTGPGRCRRWSGRGPDRPARTGRRRGQPRPASCRSRGPGQPPPPRCRWRRRKR